MTDWRASLGGDPLPWLLDESAPAVRHRALRELLDRPADDPDVVEAGAAAMSADPIAAILTAQDPEGWWIKPGGGYSPKYTGTVWSVIFLDQLGADGGDERVTKGCGYVLDHAQTPSGGFGYSGGAKVPPPSSVIHCLNGNLLRSLIGLGWLQDERVQRALAWQAGAITGEGHGRWYAAIPGPGLCCGVNEGLPCGWGAAKAVLGLARVPVGERSAATGRAIRQGVEFLLSVSAVGSLKEEYAPLDMLVPDQLIDRTQQRRSTFFGRGLVAHVAFAHPFCRLLSRLMVEGCGEAGSRHHRGGTYVCIEGPAFSTLAESELYRSWGADVVGMTNLQEAKLAREAEICYATLAMVTDYDCWHPDHDAVTAEQIIGNLGRNAEMAKAVLRAAVRRMPVPRDCECATALRYALVTAPDDVPAELKRELAPIIGRYIS